MILGWSEFAARSTPVDICIVGGGAAGLTLAASLCGSGLSVIVLEAGAARQTKASQAFYEGDLADPASHPWLHHFRVRAIGGSSRIWGGRCVPFDPVDFERRDWAPGPGWPIGFAEVAEHYPAAQAAAEAGAYDYDPATTLPGRQAEFAPGLDGEMIATRLERFSRPTDFWRRFGAKLKSDPHVHVVMEAPATAIRLKADGGAVDHIEVRGPGGELAQVTARTFVIAAGGLETVRLLLASNDVTSCGVGGGSGHLGRYYMSHLAATAGQIVFADPSRVAFDYERDDEGIYVRRRLALTEAAQRQARCLNVVFRTHLPDAADPSHGDPILSAMYLVKDLVLFEYSRKMRQARPTLGQRLSHFGNIVRHPLRLGGFSRNWILRRVLSDRKLPSVVLGSRTGAYPLEFHAEQASNPDSRLTLGAETDAFGMPRLKADWRLTQLDTESLQRAYALLAAELKRTGVGELTYDPDDVAEAARREGAYGGHHIGAARMSALPGEGVVDRECRVHGVGNLYLASSAVFPTSGQANPTLTILALTLRLGARIRQELKR